LTGDGAPAPFSTARILPEECFRAMRILPGDAELQKVAMTMRDTQQAEPVIDILTRVASELTDIADGVSQLHSMIDCIDQGGIRDKSAFIHSAQAIDILEQRACGLAHFITELAELMPDHWELESAAAARKLKLSELATRLTRREIVEVMAAITPGESEFF
jgi:hypothetical protein